MPPITSIPRYRLRHGDLVAGFVVSSLATTIRASFRVVYDDGTDDELVVPDFTTVATRTLELLKTETRAKKDGYVVSGVVISVTTLPKRGQTYVVLWTAQETEGVNVKDQLIGDYLYGLHTPSLGNIVDPGPGGGEGFIRTVTIADPAAGTDAGILYTVPTNAVGKLRSWTGTLVTSADVANRVPQTEYTDGTDIIAVARAGAVTDASKTNRYAPSIGGGNNFDNETNVVIASGTITYPLPDITLLEGYVVQITTQNFDTVAVADNWGAIFGSVEEWLVI